MPDPRPFSSLRSGQYDEPPASSTASTPRTRRNRLQQALRATADIARDDIATGTTTSSQPPFRGSGQWHFQRRRQRSPAHDPRESPMAGPDVEDSRRRRSNKRRRLDSETSTSTEPPIKYGFYGQVEPGRLKLQLISCDGGEHRDPHHPATYLGSHNILRHDKSVYCSERPTTNLVLRHADDMPFCLEKLHIVGPEHGFTAPVREGIVYVAMTMSDLRNYMDVPPHAQRYSVNTPPYARRRSFRSSPERISLSEALRDPEVGNALDARERAQPPYQPPSWHRSRTSYRDDDDVSGQSDPEANCEPSATIAPYDMDLPSSDHVPITVLSDEEPGPEENSSQDVLDFRLQRLRSMRRRYERDNWDRADRWAGLDSTHFPDGTTEWDSSWSLRHLDAMMARSRMNESPHADDSDDRTRAAATADPSHPRTLPDGYRSAAAATAEPMLDAWHDAHVTRARFYIRAGKHKVAIKFDPPVSGRFILLKLWANRSNVDVQSVIAKGYGGARFFPAVDFR